MSESLTRLRERIAGELEVLTPMPDLTDAVRRQGLARRRRRRAATGLAVSVTAIGAGYALPQIGSGGPGAVPQDRFATDGASTTAGVPQGPEVSEEQWRAAIRDTFAALLPERFGPVVDNADREGQHFDVAGAEPFWFHFSVRGRAPMDTAPYDCSVIVDSGKPCVEEVLRGGWRLVAAHDRSDDSSEFAEVTLSHDTLYATAYLFTEDLRPVPLTDDELVDIARSPRFRELVRLGVDYAATRPAPDQWMMLGENGEQTTGTIPRPTWPGE